MSETVEIRVKHLTDALSDASAPLARLNEYVQSLEQLVAHHRVVEAECIAALIGVEARTAGSRMATSLEAVRAAAAKVADP